MAARRTALAWPHAELVEDDLRTQLPQRLGHKIMHAHRHRAGADNQAAARALSLNHRLKVGVRLIRNNTIVRDLNPDGLELGLEIGPVRVADLAARQLRRGIRNQFRAGA
jgi:DNA polymerase III epsilon subunit-like protein